MTDTRREHCLHCQRLIAVIGKRGQLARHHCRDNPASMNGNERVANARRAVTGVLARRANVVDRLEANGRARRRTNALLIAARIILAFAVITLIARGPNALTLIAVAAGLIAAWAGGRSLTHNRINGGRYETLLAKIDAECNTAIATLLRVEAAVPERVAHPELYPDLDNLGKETA